MNVLYFLENLRNPLLDLLFSAVTYLGHELLFLILICILFWCVNKRLGYYIIAVGLSGIIFNQILKMIFRIPRPWVIDPDFSIVENARAAATGYSFPSGHTQCAVGAYGSILLWERKRRSILVTLSALPLVLVPLSRMYLGVHTPLDVGVSLGIALLLIFLLYPAAKHADTNPHRFTAVLLFMGGFSIANLMFLSFYQFPADVDAICFADAYSNAWKLIGAAFGMAAVWIYDHDRLHFDTKAIWYAQIMKVVGGLILVLLIKEGCKWLFALLLPYPISDTIRYFLVVLAAGILWPMTFPWFAKLGKHTPA